MSFSSLHSVFHLEGNDVDAFVEAETGHRFDPQEAGTWESCEASFVRVDGKGVVQSDDREAYDTFASSGEVDPDTASQVIEAAVNIAISKGLLPKGKYEVSYRW